MSLTNAPASPHEDRTLRAPAEHASAAELITAPAADEQTMRAWRTARGLALAVMALGAVAGLGQVLGVERLARWDQRYHAMVPGTALAFVLCGAALWLLAAPAVRTSARVTAAACGASVVAWALLTGAESLTSRAPRVDVVLVVGMREMAHPGRASGVAAIGLGMLAAALLALAASGARASRLVVGLTSGSALVVAFSLTAWLADAKAVRGSSAAAGLPPQTAIGLALLVAGVLLAQPDRAPVAWFIGPSFGTQLARRALAGTLAIPVATVAAGIAARALGWDDPAAAVALASALMLALLTVAVGVTRERIERVEAQRHLADAIIAGTHDAIIGLTSDGTIASWNSAAEALFGYDADSVLGSSFFALLPDGDWSAPQRALDGQGVSDAHTRALRKDGEQFDVSLTVSPVLDARAGRVAASVIARDVSARMRTEQELEQQRRALRDEHDFTAAILNTAGALVMVIDPAGRIERFNAACEQASGYLAADVTGVSLFDVVIAREDRPAVEGALHRGRDGEDEHDWIARDGSRRTIHWSIARLLSAGDALEHLVCVGTDVTERRRSERALAASDGRLRQLFEQGPIGIALIGLDGRWVNVNPALCRLLGYTKEALARRTVADVTHPDDVETSWVELDRLARNPDGEHRHRKRFLHAGGATVPVHVSTSLWRSESGRTIGMVAHIEDESARAQAEARFHQLFEAAPIAMARLDREQRLVEVNPAFCQLLGHSAEHLTGRAHDELVHPDDIEAAREAFSRLGVGPAGAVENEHRYVHASGNAIWAASTKTLLPGQGGESSGAIVQVLDITERRQHDRQLRYLADHDPLTGLLNRRAFNVELDRQLARIKRYGSEGAVILLDLDHFKHINDTFGHGAGDQLITTVADVLRGRLRESDIIARLGGDEFAVLLPKGDATEAMAVAEKLVEQIRDTACVLDGQDYHVTASVGVATFAADGDGGAADLLVCADLAMYHAKEAGRDRAHVYDPGRARRSAARLSRVEQIRRALDEDAFILHAQPIHDLRAGTVTRYELLVRLRDEDGNPVLPASWLAIAEHFDLIQRVDRWVTRTAIQLLAGHHAAGEDVALSVNLSGKSIGDERLLSLIRQELAQAPHVDSSKLVFEITETAAIQNIAHARAFALQVRALGCRLALDDFGAGFGSFYYLKHLPFDYVKIDGEFVENCATSRTDRLVVESLVAIAHGLGKETIAEFVTDQPTLEYLRSTGVDYAQGHHIGAARDLRGQLTAGPRERGARRGG